MSRSCFVRTGVFVAASMAAAIVAHAQPKPPRPPDFAPLAFVFPPNPPPLGALIVDPHGSNGGPAAMRAIAEFVAEPFYPPLGTQLLQPDSDGRLSRAQQELVDAFRHERTALLAELRERLPQFAALAPADRQANWEKFSRDRAPRLAALESRAEQLRERLASGVNWNGERAWRLGRGKLKRPRDELRTLESFVFRAAVYYQAGLSPGQRRLMREHGIQLESEAFGRANPPPPEGAFVWFSPDTAQIFLPAETPPAIARAFVAYGANRQPWRKCWIRSARRSAAHLAPRPCRNRRPRMVFCATSNGCSGE